MEITYLKFIAVLTLLVIVFTTFRLLLEETSVEALVVGVFTGLIYVSVVAIPVGLLYFIFTH